MSIRAWCLWIVVLCLVAPGIDGSAQTSTPTVRGTVVDEDGQPLGGVTIAIRRGDDQRSRGTFTTSNGRFALDLPEPGSWSCTVRLVGYRVIDTTINVTDDVAVDLVLQQDSLTAAAVVVAASRVREKAIEAPASVSIVDQETIAMINAPTPSSYVQGLPGVNLVDKGIGRTSLSIRGYADVMAGGVRTLADMRNVRVPALGFDINYYMTVVGPDIERIEIIRGPASALFGPNMDAGVMNVVTKSPFVAPGLTVDLMGGERGLFQGVARVSTVLSEAVALKVSAGYMRGEDWQYTDPIEQTARDKALAVPGVDPDTVLVGKRDPIFERAMFDARIDVALGEVEATVEGGYHQMFRGIETAPAGVGGIQVHDAVYWYAHTRVTWERLFAQVFVNTSLVDNNILLRTGQLSKDRPSEVVARLQHGFTMGEHQTFTYGGDMFLTYPNSDGTVYGQFEDSNDVSELGAYLQSETALLDDRLHITLTARLDQHSELESPVFTPRVALTYAFNDYSVVRAMYNRAFQVAPPGAFFFDVVGATDVFGFGALDPSFATKYRVRGVPASGYTFTQVNGQYNFYSPFAGSGTVPIPVGGVSALWPVVVQALATQGVDISSIPAPTPAQVSGVMRMLDAETTSFGPAQTTVDNVARIQPLIRDFFEVGGQATFGNVLTLSLDLYQQQFYSMYVTTEVTPSVFMNAEQLTAYLVEQGLTQEQAAPLAATIGSIPLGTVTPDQVEDKTAIMATAITKDTNTTVRGFDFGATFDVTNELSLIGSLSMMEQNLQGLPPSIGTISVRYADAEAGIMAQARFRHHGGFTVIPSTYVESGVAPYNLIDVMATYRLPFYRNCTLSLNITNLLDHVHQEMVGNPSIGRMSTLRATLTY